MLTGRNKIVASFCPQVFGLYVVKLCICLSLIGGVEVQSDIPLHSHVIGHVIMYLLCSMWMCLELELEVNLIFYWLAIQVYIDGCGQHIT